ncbi:MAG: sigma factor-like helix-turn-helix DNA-binding protein [Minisyncoccia bacterium]
MKNTIKETTVKLVAILNPRNRDVISRRFGLKTGKKETLESIGQSYGITRERVRQIEEASLKQMKDFLASATDVKVKPFIALAENILEQNGGVMNEQELFDKYFGSPVKNTASESANSSLVFMMALDGNLQRSPDDDQFNPFWAISAEHADAFRNSVASFVKALSKNENPVAETALADFTKKSGISSKYTSSIALNSYLSISKEIGKNIFGHVGLTSWPEIKPRGVRDKSYLVLKKVGEPKHFREITRLINDTFHDRKANVQTVHNELIKDNRFVLVGRGLYGLSEMGYKAGTVKDVLVDLLKSASKPVKKTDLVAQVLSHRMVKENTILLNLQDSKVFKKTEDGYTLQA